MSQQLEDLKARYERALHAIQTGVAYEMAFHGAPDYETGPSPGGWNKKHLRVGINAAMVDTSAIVNALIKKQVISEREFYEALVEQAEAEVARYEATLKELYGGKTDIKLG